MPTFWYQAILAFIPVPFIKFDFKVDTYYSFYSNHLFLLYSKQFFIFST